MSLRRLLMISMSVSILFVQEQMLILLPNISFTVLLIVFFASVFSFKENILLITAYVILDNLYLGGFNVFYMIPMLLAWYLIPISYHTILRRTKSELKLAFFALGFGFAYGWMFAPFAMIQFGLGHLWPYLVADVGFEILMSISGFITVYWLFKPLYKAISPLILNQKRFNEKSYE